MAADEEEAPGWYAIDSALVPLYGEDEPPFHYAPKLPAVLGGPDPIDGISVYRSNAFGREHWHFVTYGFTELYAKETSDPTVSGYGFELTFRVVRTLDEKLPPSWAFNFLQNIGRYVFSTGNTFEPGHHMNLNSSIAVGSSSAIRAIAFTRDPELLENIQTPHGSLNILQVIGVTLDELAVIRQWDSEKLLTLLGERIPGGLTDLERDSLLLDPRFAIGVQAGIACDGSSTGTLFPSVASFRHSTADLAGQVTVTLGANGVRDLLQVFPGRLPFARPLAIIVRDTIINFAPCDVAGWQISSSEPTLNIYATQQFASELVAVLRAEAGEYHFESMPDLVIAVERSAITDREGNVVEWVG